MGVLKCPHCISTCKSSRVEKFDKSGLKVLRKDRQKVRLKSSLPRSPIFILEPDECALGNDTRRCCDFYVEASLMAVLLEFKTGSWNYGHVKDQFIGGLARATSLGRAPSRLSYYVVAGSGASGATQSLSGLQTIFGRPMR